MDANTSIHIGVDTSSIWESTKCFDTPLQISGFFLVILITSNQRNHHLTNWEVMRLVITCLQVSDWLGSLGCFMACFSAS